MTYDLNNLPDWFEREKARFDAGEYQPVPWPENLTQYPGHFLHLSETTPGNVAFTQSSAHGERDRQTTIKPGKYLTKYFPDLPPPEVARLAVAGEVAAVAELLHELVGEVVVGHHGLRAAGGVAAALAAHAVDDRRGLAGVGADGGELDADLGALLGDGLERVDDLAALDQMPIRAIAVIPTVNLDEETVVSRFGNPGERLAVSENRVHLLYPDKGLDVVVDRDGKELLQYVAPRDFALLRDPLKASAAGKNPAQ